MRKLITFLAALFVAVSMVAMFAACGEKAEETPKTDTTTTDTAEKAGSSDSTDTTNKIETKEEPKTTESTEPKSDEGTRETLSQDAFMGIVVFETNYGNFELSLYKDTPIAGQNMIDKVKAGFYNNLTFHRVVKGFVIQGGDPTGSGAGGGQMAMDPKSPTNRNIKGTAAMASSSQSQPIDNQSDCQFFINTKDNTHLDYPYGFSVFGLVTSGYETIEKIENVECVPGGEGSTPVEKVVIKNASLK